MVFLQGLGCPSSHSSSWRRWWGCCSLVPGPAPHNGVGCGRPKGSAPICGPAAYTLPGHLCEPPPWPSHLPAGPQTRGETLGGRQPLPSLRPIGLKSVMGSDWGIGLKKPRSMGRGCAQGLGIGSVGALALWAFLTSCFFHSVSSQHWRGWRLVWAIFLGLVGLSK